MEKDKPNCYKCEHRGTLPGNAHSRCLHPIVKDVTDDPLAQVFGIFAGVGRVNPFMVGAEKLNIKADPHGIKNGWFVWPVNFDPVWLDACDGFTKKVDQDQNNR